VIKRPKCSVPNCSNPAAFEVILYDVYDLERDFDVFFEQDETCPFICSAHAAENELSCPGPRQYRGVYNMCHTNQHGAQGITIYRPLAENELS
jgi:hypothetical protein